MHNNRTSNDGATASASSHGLPRPQLHIPLESDVERGFASRAKNHKRPTSGATSSGKNASPSALSQDTRPSPSSIRRRRIGLLAATQADDSADSVVRQRLNFAKDLLDAPTPADSPSDPEPPVAAAAPESSVNFPRRSANGYSSLGSSFSRLRTRSAPGAANVNNFFNFRGGSTPVSQLDTHHESPA